MSYSTELLHRCGPNNRTLVNFNCNSPTPILKQVRGIISEMKRTKATNTTPLPLSQLHTHHANSAQ